MFANLLGATGDVCRLASFYGLRTPALRAVYESLLELTARPYAGVHTVPPFEATMLELAA